MGDGGGESGGQFHRLVRASHLPSCLRSCVLPEGTSALGSGVRSVGSCLLLSRRPCFRSGARGSKSCLVLSLLLIGFAVDWVCFRPSLGCRLITYTAWGGTKE